MTDFERLAVGSLAVYYGLGALAATGLTILAVVALAPYGVYFAPFLLGFAALLAAVALGLWRWRRWAWYVGAALTGLAVAAGVLRMLAPATVLNAAAPNAAAVLGLLNGLGFVINAAALYALLQPGVRRRFREGAPPAA